MKSIRSRFYIIAVCAIILPAVLVTPVLGAMGPALSGVNIPGNDIGTMVVGSKEECASACDANPSCLAATYVLPGTIQGPEGHCWLKSATTPHQENFNCYSFIKQIVLPTIGCVSIPPTAEFIGTPREGFVPFDVQFTDQSTGAQTWVWDFGDDGTSGLKNPTHVYTYPGTYTVKQTVTESCMGYFDTKTRTAYINAKAQVQVMGTLEVSSIPSGAEVYVDGVDMGISPLVKHLSAGSHTILLSLSGYNDYSTTVTMTNGVTIQLPVTLTKSSHDQSTTGSLRITTTPDGAAVSIDGGSQGITPVTVSGLAAGSHTVRLTKAGYPDYQQTITIPSGQITPLHIELPEGTGSLSVSSFPAGASVNLDGGDKGITPITIPQVKAGLHTLILIKTGYQDYSTTVTVTDSSTAQVTANLITQDQKQSLTVRSTPTGAKVYLDGGMVGTTPLMIPDVTAGTHKVLLTMQNYENISQTIEVTVGSDKEVIVDLKKNSPIIPPSIAPLVGIATGILIGASASVFTGSKPSDPAAGKFQEFIRRVLGNKAVDKMASWEKKKLKIHAIRRKELFAGLSLIEILVATTSAVLIGGAFYLMKRDLFDAGIKPALFAISLFIAVAGASVILNDLARRWIARRHGHYAEYKMWLLGTISLYLTAWLLGTVCGKPSRPVYEGTMEKNPRELAFECLAGPAASVIFACFFAFLIPLGGYAATIGILGVSINVLLALYGLMPFEPMDGLKVWRWSRGTYVAIFLPLLGIYIGIAYLFQ